MNARKDPELDRNRSDLFCISSVEAQSFFENSFTHQLFFYIVKDRFYYRFLLGILFGKSSKNLIG